MSLLLLLLLLPFVCSASSSLCSSQVCLPVSYNAMNMPHSGSQQPFQVNYSILLLDIYGVQNDDFTIDTNIAMTLTWFDDRIMMSNRTNDSISVDVRFIDNLWKPDIYFYDLKSLTFTEGISPEKGLRLAKKGGRVEVTFKMEVQLVFVCPMVVSMFPFDRHICNMRFTSFSR